MDITPFPPRTDALPALVRPVPLGAALRYHVNGDLRFGQGNPTPEQAEADPRQVPHLSPASGGPTPADIAEAKRRLPEAEHLCRPGQPPIISAWCGRMRSLPFAPVDETAVQGAIAAIVMACVELPTAVWTVETVGLALRTFKRWPAPAEVFSFMSQQARPLLSARDGLRRVAATDQPAPPAPPAERSRKARDAVTAAVRAFEAERMYHRSGTTPDEAKPKPAPLSSGVMLRLWEQAAKNGVPGADIRLAMLRKNA